MSAHALEVLEFDRALERVGARASSDLGREHVFALAPSADLPALRRELARVDAAMRFVDEKPAWGLPAIPDVRGALAQLAAGGAVLEPLDLYGLGVLLTSSRLVGSELASREARHEDLATVRERLVADKATEDVLARSVDGDGQVLDTASKELRRLRDRMRGAHARVVRQLEAYLRKLPERYRVDDASVSIRDGRYVIPIRREGKGAVGGIVHDESQTGATLFVEPPVAIELMNQLRELEREEGREIRRILGELSARLTPSRDVLAGALDALVELDSLLARARSALAWRASVPALAEAGAPAFRLLGARHPLLVETSESPVVPFDLEVEPGERALVVSGPNTGGKSVFLKAVGLITALAQSGVVPPVGEGTVLPLFGAVFADIGDEQSIVRSLSTFSAHLGNLSDLVADADARSLVLIDEMGTGTDPAEGAALARAVLEELVARGAFTLVSSHLGELKRLDGEGSGIVNASLQFDPDRMEPTYQLVKGRPGRSYGLAIARRLGFPAGVLDRAEGYLQGGEARVEDLLERLERREREAERQARELETERTEASRLRADVVERERALRAAERSAEERARDEARRVLMEARAEVEEAITEVRAAAEAGDDLEQASKSARRRVEKAARKHRPVAGRGRSQRGRAASRGTPGDVAVGDRVRMQATGATGSVVELREGRAVVEVGALRLELPADDLEVLESPEAGTGARSPEERRRGGGWTGPPRGRACTEVDLRGLRVDEVGGELMRALDQAILEDLAELRVIHGKGTGALRQRVTELLDGDARVAAHRAGGPAEGGTGVTMVTLR